MEDNLFNIPIQWMVLNKQSVSRYIQDENLLCIDKLVVPLQYSFHKE